jgi:hypothetical protein
MSHKDKPDVLYENYFNPRLKKEAECWWSLSYEYIVLGRKALNRSIDVGQ